MKPVFFPFTLMTGKVLAACRRFFKQIVVIQATEDNIPNQLKAWQVEGLIDILSLKSEKGDISAMLRDYRAWAQYHQGGDISVYKYYKDRIPFFDDTSFAQIKKDIRSAGTGEKTAPASAADDRLLQARLFLQMAQEFDEQSLDIARTLEDQEEMKRVLFEGLRGEGGMTPMPDKTGSSTRYDDPFGYMLSDRLNAWTRGMMAHEMFDDFFITNSRETIELAVGDAMETESPVHMQRIPGFTGGADVVTGLQEAFMAHLKKLSQMLPSQFHEKTVPQFSVENGDEDMAMEVYTIPGISPPDFFPRFLPKDVMAQTVRTHDMGIKNTILGLILPAG
jgi:hypothetical protein